MTVSIEELRPHLQAFDFTRLFVEGLGWDHYPAEPFAVQVNEQSFSLKPVAEKAGFVVFECVPVQNGSIPPYPARRKIESQVAKLAFEHLVIFVDLEQTTQTWQWVKREAGRPAACREQQFNAGQGGDPLLQRLRQIAFTLDEEAGLTISTVASKVVKALDVEKVTKRFYERFRKELTAFGDFIDGITAQGDRGWYASLMLNRMMFVYFVQKQGFLDDDIDYLRNKLREVQSKHGDGRFQQFYRAFLLKLFHKGLGQPEAQRSPELAVLLGKVPFLNGGLFDVHDLERDNPEISIPDEAFERVFDFFDDYRWHLDERPYRDDNEINPDVLGHIFEKYVNQKQMGAYYTKEDITGYISRNTVIPFLFDAAKKKCPVAFGPDGGVWRLLRDDPDRYIYPAVGHGISWNARQVEDPKRLDAPHDLPEDIAAGIAEVSKRGGWNKPAPDQYALPTETWREVVARRQRHSEVRAKLASGEVRAINDLITLNLDIEQFAMDVIVQSEGPELLRAFWHAMRDISVLDPTCGSGAFLFAALNILEPLYTACLEGMRGFLDDAERSERKRRPEHLGDFRRILEQMDKHPSERYFILKSIVLNNLYGVDIMEEARDAMTLTPDGQHRMLSDEDERTLALIEERADDVNRLAGHFREQQTMLGGEVTAEDKANLRKKLESLGSELDRYLATEYGVEFVDSGAYEAWRSTHQPFHWFVEFYGIVSKGGFDVVIGNPPYVEYSKVKRDYTVTGYETGSCGNLYAYVMERCKTLTNQRASLSMIVPLSGHSTQRMQPLVKHFYDAYESCHLFNISADAHPSILFNGVRFRLAIFVASNLGTGMYTTGYSRWYAEQRDNLFGLLEYTEIGSLRYPTAIPKVSSRLHLKVLRRLLHANRIMRDSLTTASVSRNLVLYHSTPVNWIRSHSVAPYFRSDRDGKKVPNGLNTLMPEPAAVRSIHAIMPSTVFFLWWLSLSDCYHLNKPEVLTFPMCDSDVLESLSRELEEDMQSKSKRRVYHYKATGRVEYDEFYLKRSKPIIDKIDHVLAQHYGFTDEELDFVINYDIKYRMGRAG